MTIQFLIKMLTNETVVYIRDKETKAIYKSGTVAELKEMNYTDKVKDWDFSNNHIIYI